MYTITIKRSLRQENCCQENILCEFHYLADYMTLNISQRTHTYNIYKPHSKNRSLKWTHISAQQLKQYGMQNLDTK